MSAWQVLLVTAFGRGETLGLALREQGFDVQTLDFTPALTDRLDRGAGPFPIVTARFQPKQSVFLDDVKPLARGLTLWRREGPIELSGPMADHFAASEPAAATLRRDKPAAEFEEDWLRRFLIAWTSPFHVDPWERPIGAPFPFSMEMGLLPPSLETRALSFERYRALEYKYTAASHLHDVVFEGSRLAEILFEAGRKTALRADQWIWCLSSSETESLNAPLAQRLFNGHVRAPEWRYLSFAGSCERGPWTSGFPEYSALLDDVHLPWVYANFMILRWLESDAFRVWLKVPDAVHHLPDRRAQWAIEAERALMARLPMANWKVDPSAWSICPHSPVFEARAADHGAPSWRNWDWIAPETLKRLDFSARLEAEAASLARLERWRQDLLKKKGAAGDHALHAP